MERYYSECIMVHGCKWNAETTLMMQLLEQEKLKPQPNKTAELNAYIAKLFQAANKYVIYRPQAIMNLYDKEP